MSTRAWFCFFGVSLLWGIPYLFIKIAVDDGVPPAFLAWVRVVLGALILLPLAWRLGLLGELRGTGKWLVAYAVLEIAIPWPLIGAGEQHVSSSLTAILIAAVPLIVALLALRFDHTERVHGSRLAGLLIGFLGVILLVGLDIAGNGDELLGAAAILVAAVGYAAAPMIFKRKLADVDARAVMAASLAFCAIALAPLAFADLPDSTPSTDALVSLIVLGVACTAAALVLFGVLVAEVGAGKALVITYVAPVVAVALGVAVLDERPGAGAIAGLLLIIAGSWLSTDGRLPPGLAGVFSRLRTRRGATAPEPSGPG
jgi:drug/metabolite transporter (DMT)-like permease